MNTYKQFPAEIILTPTQGHRHINKMHVINQSRQIFAYLLSFSLIVCASDLRAVTVISLLHIYELKVSPT